MAHDELLQSYRREIFHCNLGLSIALGPIIVINIFALLHKHEKITKVRVDDVQHVFWRYSVNMDISKMVKLQDTYDSYPDRFNEIFLENPDLEKLLKARFAVDRSLLMLQTALSIFAAKFVMFNQWSVERLSSAKIAVFGLLAVSLFSYILLFFVIPFTTMFNFFNDSLSSLYMTIPFVSKGLALWCIGCGGYYEYKCWLIVKCNAPGREQVALAEVNVHRGHRELAALAGQAALAA
ncbi:uncharacterized protein LOC135837409 [Planococcus citri]|uniref:uncharacterized protein LOC135837409 n=1 Tax=Planococcus citri TaxID=170843 RepID=UPI0031F8A69D